MTKFPIRSIIIACLEIKKGDRLLDIGCGTGSVSVEAAAQGASVLGIDKNKEAVELTLENSKKFSVNLEIVCGRAPEDLPRRKFNKCFIGGSTGSLNGIFAYLEENLESQGVLVASFITMKNAYDFKRLLAEYKYENIQTYLIQTAEEDRLGLLKGQNPIFIIKGEKAWYIL